MRDARRADTAATGVAGLQPLAEGFAVHLADGGEREVVEDVDLARVLVGGQAGARELDQLIGAGAQRVRGRLRRVPVAEHHAGRAAADLAALAERDLLVHLVEDADLVAGQRQPDRAEPAPPRRGAGDDRARLGAAVALADLQPWHAPLDLAHRL